MPKRTRAESTNDGLAAGTQLERASLLGNDSPWGWVGTEAKTDADVTLDHRLRTCGLSHNSKAPFCANLYATGEQTRQNPPEELDDDIIVVSDTLKSKCSKKLCKNNPNCLNHLGQNIWENDAKEAWEAYCKLLNLGDNPSLDTRNGDTPVGLRNLGATCYANAYLQVWFQNLAFRDGVYSCQPMAGAENSFRDSPIYHLQVTFSALESSTRDVFNPENLVESLQLRTTEQQDAQEFAKLFMSHLDNEFSKQPKETLRSLITTQFSGKQVYGTICSACKNTSQTEADFYEIEVNLTENAKLEECISSALRNETLSGENRYFCSQCASLQDATRFIQLRRLPPVLHISLLRFVYDFKSMERKKSKHAITFPAVLDMSQFVPSQTIQLYDLRGILLHKGMSAHHGHYEAQIFDIKTQKWYQINDEIVSQITHLGDKPAKKKSTVIVDEDDSDSSTQPTRKRRKTAPGKKKKPSVADPSGIEGDEPQRQLDITSKDAYMLIYTHREESHPVPNSAGPPCWAQEAVDDMNKVHKDACSAYEVRLQTAKDRFVALCHQVRDIYHSWNCTADQEEFAVVSRQSLERWLTNDAMESDVIKSHRDQATDYQTKSEKQKARQGDIVCEHGNLKPGSSDLKRIRLSSLHAIVGGNIASLFPVTHFSPLDACGTCVQQEFLERLYRIEHPKIVRRFEQSDYATDDGYWISAQWLKDWKLMRPKMHTSSKADPGPDTDPHNEHVRCVHGGLAFNVMARRKISVEACAILQGLFPLWEPLSIQAESCAICEALYSENKAAKQQSKIQADKEKCLMKTLPEAAKGAIALLENVPCSLLPSKFLQEWRDFVFRPSQCNRPTEVDTSAFYCEHKLLCFDPNIKADMSELVVIKREDWQQLENLYSCGPSINIEKKVLVDGSTRFFHDIEVCSACRTRRKTNFDTTVVTVRILGENVPVSAQYLEASPPTEVVAESKSGTRKSKRLRQSKNRAEQQNLIVTKETSVKDIKDMLRKAIKIPTFSQRLFYKGQELEDEQATVASLSILMGDILEMKEIEEKEDDLNEMAFKKARREEAGFDGTLLGGGGTSRSPSSGPSTAEGSPLEEVDSMKAKVCPACTLQNAYDASRCKLCQAELDQCVTGY